MPKQGVQPSRANYLSPFFMPGEIFHWQAHPLRAQAHSHTQTPENYFLHFWFDASVRPGFSDNF